MMSFYEKYIEAQKEIEKLRSDLSFMTKECKRQEEEVERLQAALWSYLRPGEVMPERKK